MEKLAMCRMCLRQNVRMSVVVDNNLQELYEKLTNIPFVTDDSRPLLACFFCFAKLKQCYQLQKQCLEAEELFTQLINEPHILANRCQLEVFKGFTKTPIENINIVDVVQFESVVIKEELPAVCERQDDTIEVKVEWPSAEGNKIDTDHSDVEDTPLQHSETGLDDVSLGKYIIEVGEDQEVLRKKQRASDMKFTMTNRPSYAQLEVLVNFLEQNPGIAKGLLRTTLGKMETKKKWANLASTLNSLGGINKNGQGWAKYWAEKKCGLKIKASMKRTAGGTADNLPALSALDSRLVAIIAGQEFATGDSRWTVNPFPQSTRPTEPPVVTEDVETVQEGTAMDSVQNISPIPGSSHKDAIPASTTIPALPKPLHSTTSVPPRRRRRRSLIPRPLDANMEHFARIEKRRVEAELLTARAFAQFAEHIGNIASALTSIANAILVVARKMPNP